MRVVSTSMKEKLDSRASTFCNCWRVARRDGIVMGFTDHDSDVFFNGVLFKAKSGFLASELESTTGFASGGGDVVGALTTESLTEADLANGVYDGASVEIWLVDWSSVEDRVLLDVATLGEATRSEFVFRAEVRSSAHYFDQQRGTCFQRSCPADLGDTKCKFDLSTPGFSASGVVIDASREQIFASLVGAFDDDFFAAGQIVFSSGANLGARTSIKSHRRKGDKSVFSIWSGTAAPILAGDAFTVIAGCDKSPDACQAKFNNLVNFRGFPHMPGNDHVIAFPSSLAPVMDGGSFFR
jgi:uncharacterized phage protein (TIGR02218 family)